MEDARAEIRQLRIFDHVRLDGLITEVACQFGDLRIGDRRGLPRHDLRPAGAALEGAQLRTKIIGVLSADLRVLRIGAVAIGAVAGTAAGCGERFSLQGRCIGVRVRPLRRWRGLGARFIDGP